MRTSHSAPPRVSGFSLVELAVALGIVSFALVSILGLLGAATKVNADSGRDTVVVSMASQVMTDLRSVPFDALWKEDHREAAKNSSSEPPTGAPEEVSYFFSSEGAFLEAGENDPDAIYRCTVQKHPDEATRTPGLKGRYNLLNLQLVFGWPAFAPEANRETHTVHGSIARY